MRKKLCVIAMNPETENEIGKCQNNCGLRVRPVSHREIKKTGMHSSQATPQMATPNQGKCTNRRRNVSSRSVGNGSPRYKLFNAGRSERISHSQMASAIG